MKKDFAQSYDQLHWKNAADSHARYSKMIQKFPNGAAIGYAKQRIEAIEREFPCLKTNLTNNFQ